MLTLSNIEPVADRVVIRRDDLPEKSAGGIFIPRTVKNNQTHGIVLKAGPEATVKPGDKIFFTNSTSIGMQVEVEEEKLFVMPELGIIAVK